MPEGKGGAVSVNVDFKDLWTAVHDVANWVGSESTVDLASNVFVIPKGVQSPNELPGWNPEPSQLYVTHKWTGISSDTRIRVGVNWYFGGQYNSQGRYIGNADVSFRCRRSATGRSSTSTHTSTARSTWVPVSRISPGG